MLVVVADHRRSQIYSTDRLHPPWTNLDSLVNPSSHMPEHELGTDAPGRTMNRASGAHQAYEPASSIHQEAARRFARQISDAITQRAGNEPLAAIALVAEARLLHEIKDACPAPIRARIALEVPKDLTHEPLPDLANRLRAAAEDKR